MQDEKLQKIENFSTPDENLEGLGVKTYTMSGEQFFSFLQENLPLLQQESSRETWCAACKAGESRSVKMNRFLEKKGLSVAILDPREPDSGSAPYGLDQIKLNVIILAADYDQESGMITPEGFRNNRGFNRLILFVGTQDNTDQLRRLLASSLGRLAGRSGIQQFSDLKVIIVADDDRGSLDDLITNFGRS